MDKNNEDIWGHSEFAAWIFDGATGLSPDALVAKGEKTDPRWLVEAADESLKRHADKIEDMHRLYATVVHDCVTAFHKEQTRAPQASYELPMAACIVIRKFSGRVICGALSDCTMLIETIHGLQRMDPCPKHAVVDDTTRAKMTEAIESGLSPLEARDHLIPHLRNNRKMANQPNGYDVFAPDPAVADRARVETFHPAPEGHALLMTDGFYALVDSYNAYDDASLMEAAKSKGLEALYKELRDIENADSAIRTYPRFKQSDDATAFLVAV